MKLQVNLLICDTASWHDNTATMGVHWHIVTILQVVQLFSRGKCFLVNFNVKMIESCLLTILQTLDHRTQDRQNVWILTHIWGPNVNVIIEMKSQFV